MHSGQWTIVIHLVMASFHRSILPFFRLIVHRFFCYIQFDRVIHVKIGIWHISILIEIENEFSRRH